jgi:hypothetical protein
LFTLISPVSGPGLPAAYEKSPAFRRGSLRSVGPELPALAGLSALLAGPVAQTLSLALRVLLLLTGFLAATLLLAGTLLARGTLVLLARGLVLLLRHRGNSLVGRQ